MNVCMCFLFTFLWWLVMLTILSYVSWSFMYLFWKMSIQTLYPFLNRDICLLLSCWSSLYILDINSLSDAWFANIFFPFHRLPFHSLDCFLCCEEVLNFDIAHLCLFLLCYLCFFGVIFKKSLSNSVSWGFAPAHVFF